MGLSSVGSRSRYSPAVVPIHCSPCSPRFRTRRAALPVPCPPANPAADRGDRPLHATPRCLPARATQRGGRPPWSPTKPSSATSFPACARRGRAWPPDPSGQKTAGADRLRLPTQLHRAGEREGARTQARRPWGSARSAPLSASSVIRVCRLSCHRPVTSAFRRIFFHAVLSDVTCLLGS